ncbi:hypothetical protein SAMN05192533_110195 [Mesobacillus persicus]|uniref:PhoD-like phosphatase n=1 Tax=Mesobacillus persicus TaxID=930146 RepID=A0A1H8F2L4_9BACI|nr:hypothetical protein [Mesobacillus persicus]SEN25870.1 hypothetical protein SAMN05192533_110195 [Mesobacillus persicus]
MELPTILSGPILRRVEKHQVYIWIATSLPLKIMAELYTIERGSELETFEYHLLSNQSNTNTVQMGEKLFIHLINITPQQGSFPTETLLGYNLFFLDGSKKMDLDSFGLLSTRDNDSIVYGGLKYPSFFINDQLESHILYGSCRKLHGDGEDALAAGDEAVWESYLNLEKRPSSLFMVGDQIYADDVADPIAPYIFKLGKELIGANELLSLSKLDHRLDKTVYQGNLAKVHGRKPIMDDLCQFTSRKSDNHLMTIGEYAAMYLLSWSPQLWELDENTSFDRLVEEDSYFMYYQISEELESIDTYTLARKEKKFRDQQEQLDNFQNTLPQVRRLMANVPTYMIFDDHDLTDDWNLSLEWKQKVSESPLGRHVIANGLAAYWAFQGWGNAPSAFNNKFLKTMRKHFQTLSVEGSSYEKWAQVLWEFDSWSFIAPTQPTTVFLDTRTQREYQHPLAKNGSLREWVKQTMEGPELVNQNGWDNVSKQLAESGWEAGKPLVIVSPVPFYGIDLIETFLYNYVSPLKLIGIPVHTFFDLEAWKYNGKGFTQFLRTVSNWNPSTCIILSGDAHSASSAISHIHGEDSKNLDITQFTSSPMKNPTFSGFPGVLLKGAVWLFEKDNHAPTVHRYCDSKYALYQSTGKTPPNLTDSIWSEEIRYLPMEDGGIMKTKNNLGHLCFKTNHAMNNDFLDNNNKN